jgi:hypothetical protein
MSREDWSYLAGLFDGEGSVTITHHHRGHRKAGPLYHELAINIANTYEPVIQWVKDKLGFGMIHKKRCAGMPGARKDIWYWETANKKAEQFLLLILPYLKIRKAQAEEGLAFRARQKPGVDIYDDCLTMKRLNRRTEPCRIVR